MVKEKEIIVDDKIFDLIDRWLDTTVQKKNRISRFIRKVKSAYFYYKIREIL